MRLKKNKKTRDNLANLQNSSPGHKTIATNINKIK